MTKVVTGKLHLSDIAQSMMGNDAFTRHDHRLVALVEHFPAEVADHLAVVEIPDGSKYLVRDDSVITHDNGDWIDPSYDWDATDVESATVAKMQSSINKGKYPGTTLDLPGVMSLETAKMSMSSMYGSTANGRMTDTLKEIAELSSGTGVQSTIRNLIKDALGKITPQAPVYGAEQFTDIGRRNILIETLQAVVPLAKQKGSHGLVLALAKTALNETYGQAELCEDEGCDHYGTPHVCINTSAFADAGAAIKDAIKTFGPEALGVKPTQRRQLSKTDIEHLDWIFGRLVNQHGERENVDYMLAFRRVIDTLQSSTNDSDIMRTALVEIASDCYNNLARINIANDALGRIK